MIQHGLLLVNLTATSTRQRLETLVTCLSRTQHQILDRRQLALELLARFRVMMALCFHDLNDSWVPRLYTFLPGGIMNDP